MSSELQPVAQLLDSMSAMKAAESSHRDLLFALIPSGTRVRFFVSTSVHGWLWGAGEVKSFERCGCDVVVKVDPQYAVHLWQFSTFERSSLLLIVPIERLAITDVEFDFYQTVHCALEIGDARAIYQARLEGASK